MSIQKIWINDQQYRYSFYEHPSKDAPYGIFLMGTLQEIESIKFFSEEFAKTLNLFVVEVPGTGLTDPLPATFTIQDQSKLLLNFIKHMKIPCAHIISISYSAPMALELCTIWPGVLSLSMCGGTIGIVDSLRTETMTLLYDAINDRKLFAEKFIKGLTVDDGSIPRGQVIARSARRRILRHPQKQIACFCENTLRLLTYKPSKNIPKIKQPCLLFIGEKDPYVTIKKAKELVSNLSNCIFNTVKNADHLVHLEYPQKTAELLLFLTKKEINDNNIGRLTASVA